MLAPRIVELCRVLPGKKVRLQSHDPGWAQTEELEVTAEHRKVLKKAWEQLENE